VPDGRGVRPGAGRGTAPDHLRRHLRPVARELSQQRRGLRPARRMIPTRTVTAGMQSGIPVDKALGVCSAGSDDPAGGTSGIGIQLAGSQTRAAVRSDARRTLPGAPSWGRVLATTVSLWVGRRAARLRHPRLALTLTICVVAAAAIVSVAQAGGTSSRTASPPRHAVPPAWARGP